MREASLTMRGCESKRIEKGGSRVPCPVSLVPSFADLLRPLSCVMTSPSFGTFVTLLTGWVFARRRTVTGMIVAADAVGEKHHPSYRRLFAAARWSLDELGLAVFSLALPLPGGGTVVLAADDTPARKRGLKVWGAGMHGMRHDPLPSSRKKAVTDWGHSWVVLGVVVKLPSCAARHFCLPILFRLYVSNQTAAKHPGRHRGVHRTRPESAVQMLALVCGRFPGRGFHLVADGTYGGKSVPLELPANCDLTSRLRWTPGCTPRWPARWPAARASGSAARAREASGCRARSGCRRAVAGGGARHLRAEGQEPGRSRVGAGWPTAWPTGTAPRPPAAGGGGRSAGRGGRGPQAAGVLLHPVRRHRRAGADLVRPAVVGRGRVPRRQGSPGLRAAAGLVGAGRTADRAGGHAWPCLAMLLYSLVALWFDRDGHRH